MQNILGIDIGGSGIKSAIINSRNGEIISEVRKVKTPEKSTPDNVVVELLRLIDAFGWKGKVGVGFPGVINNGMVEACNNLHKKWININAFSFLHRHISKLGDVINDVDASGLAEMKYGVGKDEMGKVIIVSLGTGIGTSVFYNGINVPNFELGQIKVKGKITGEMYAAESVRKQKELSWKVWGKRLSFYLNQIYTICYPDLVILTGGVSKHSEKYEKYLHVPCMLRFAHFKNRAGIIGAALSAT